MMTLIARFQVDGYEPRQVTGLEADWFGLMTFGLGPDPARRPGRVLRDQPGLSGTAG
jgi:hypothetical protein